jgi:hypothetical protein
VVRAEVGVRRVPVAATGGRACTWNGRVSVAELTGAGGGRPPAASCGACRAGEEAPRCESPSQAPTTGTRSKRKPLPPHTVFKHAQPGVDVEFKRSAGGQQAASGWDYVKV